MSISNKTLDMRGRACPEPVIETRNMLENTNETVLNVLVDNEASSENVARAARNLGCSVTVEARATGEFCLTLKREAPSNERAGQQTQQTQCGVKENLVVLIASDTFGDGDPDLGRALIQAFISTIGRISPRPKTLIFLNAGAKLVCEVAPIIKAVEALKEQGCSVLVCGTCLDFYGLDEQLKVGDVSNMFDIASAMAAADKIIRP